MDVHLADVHLDWLEEMGLGGDVRSRLVKGEKVC